MNPDIQLPSAKAVISIAAFVAGTTMLIRWFAKDLVPTSVFSTATSVAGTTMLIRSFANEFVPTQLRQYILNKFHYFLAVFNNEITILIDEYEGLNKNNLFHAAETYLSTIFNPSTTRFRVSLPQKEKKIRVSIARNQQLRDEFCGIEFKWILMVSQRSQPRYDQFSGDQYSSSTEVRYFELSFHKKYKSKVLDEYLPYVLERSKTIKQEMKTLKLSTLSNQCWQSVNLDHPSTFETLAMDEEIKKMVIDDLERFLKRRDYYRRVGKAWKRGYLLYGPPGTGKSSFVAAIANFLKFDVYDLELTALTSNSDLRRLLISTANQSILVVEDIDASIDLAKKRPAAPRHPRPPHMYPYYYNNEGQVTLSGLLNFIDGLWSSCGDERIIVFTTNHKEKLDPALLRPGRMDLHIHMSYCTPCGFKMLANTYLGITEHPLINEVEQIIGTKKVTPAEVGEQLLKSDDPRVALRGLIEFIEKKEVENHQVAKTEEVLSEAEEEEEEIGANESLKQSIAKVKASSANAGEQLTRDEATIVLKGLMEVLNNKVEDNKVLNFPTPF